MCIYKYMCCIVRKMLVCPGTAESFPRNLVSSRIKEECESMNSLLSVGDARKDKGCSTVTSNNPHAIV